MTSNPISVQSSVYTVIPLIEAGSNGKYRRANDIIRPRRSGRAAAYSRQTFPVDDL